jgi:hypothetical protein
MYRLLICGPLLAAISLLEAAELTGKWTGEMADGHPVTLNFKTKESALAGSVVFGNDQIPIKEDTIRGTKVSFSVEIPAGLSQGFNMRFD